MVHIAGRDPIGGVVAASRNCQIVILLNCRLKDGMHKPFTISLIVESSDLFRSIDWCIARVYKHLIPENSVLVRSEEHTSELSHVAISYAVFCLKKKNTT